MRSSRIVAYSMVASVVAWAGQTTAGWVVDQVVKGEGGRQQVVLQANRMKTVMIAESGKPAVAFIIDLDAQTMTQVDYEGRQYFTATGQEYVEALRGVQQMAAGAMAEQMKQEGLKDLPPEQRKMVEEVMRSQMGQSGPRASELTRAANRDPPDGSAGDDRRLSRGALRRPGRWEAERGGVDRQGHHRLA